MAEERFPSKAEELIIQNRYKPKIPAIEVQKVLRKTNSPRIVTHKSTYLLPRPKSSMQLRDSNKNTKSNKSTFRSTLHKEVSDMRHTVDEKVMKSLKLKDYPNIAKRKNPHKKPKSKAFHKTSHMSFRKFTPNDPTKVYDTIQIHKYPVPHLFYLQNTDIFLKFSPQKKDDYVTKLDLKNGYIAERNRVYATEGLEKAKRDKKLIVVEKSELERNIELINRVFPEQRSCGVQVKFENEVEYIKQMKIAKEKSLINKALPWDIKVEAQSAHQFHNKK